MAIIFIQEVLEIINFKAEITVMNQAEISVMNLAEIIVMDQTKVIVMSQIEITIMNWEVELILMDFKL